MEANSKQIAGLVGPTAVVLTTSELLNLPIWTTHIPPLTYLNGLILFVAGLAIVRVHNYWMLDWTVLVTLTGWFLLLGGVYRMFAPEAPQMPQSTGSYVIIGILLLLGIILTFKAYK